MRAKLKAFLNRMAANGKMPGKNQLLILFLAGVLLFVIAIPTGKKEPEETEAKEDTALSGNTELERYQEYMEKRLANALEYIEGVGRAEVVITMKSSGTKVVEKDQSSSSQIMSEEDSNGGTRESEDRTSDKTSVYTQQSDGSQVPYVSKEMTPEVEGVLVIADGGDSPVVVQNITEAVQALLGVEAHKIKIMKRTDT